MDKRSPRAPAEMVARYLHRDLSGLLHLLQRSDIRELDILEGEFHIRVHRAPGSLGGLLPDPDVSVVDFREEVPLTSEIKAPLVGTFYRAGEQGMAPLIDEGSAVEESTVVGIIEALHVLTEVEAGCRGTVTRVLATDGQPVQYGQVLFEVQLSA